MSAGRPCIGLKQLLEDTRGLEDARDLTNVDAVALLKNLVVRWHMAVPLISDLIAMQQTSARLQQLLHEQIESEQQELEQQRETHGPRTEDSQATYLEGFIAGLQAAVSTAEQQLIPYNKRSPTSRCLDHASPLVARSEGPCGRALRVLGVRR